jgi:hypothetical protein
MMDTYNAFIRAFSDKFRTACPVFTEYQLTNCNISDEFVGLYIQIQRKIALKLVFGVVRSSV